jgi:hypothetical protein
MGIEGFREITLFHVADHFHLHQGIQVIGASKSVRATDPSALLADMWTTHCLAFGQ